MYTMYTRVGKYIHDKRMEKKIRLKDVGKVLSLTVTNVYHKECGIRKFTLKEVIILSETLGFSLEDLKKEALKALKEEEFWKRERRSKDEGLHDSR